MKLFSLIATAMLLSVGFTACEKDDNPTYTPPPSTTPDPGTPDTPDRDNLNPTNMTVNFVKKENCPFAYVTFNVDWNNEAYYLSDSNFLKYMPVSNKWEKLAPVPENPKCLFVYDNLLFCFTITGNIYLYDKITDTWGDSSAIIAPPEDFISSADMVSNYKCISGKLYAKCISYTLVYHPEDRSWEPISEQTFYDYYVCSIGNSGYWVADKFIHQFNTDKNVSDLKLGSNQSYVYSMTAPYGYSKMLCVNTEEYFSGRELNIAFYNPSNNSLSQYNFYDFETLHYPQISIPMAFTKIAEINGRYFVGPTAGEYYEMILVNAENK